MSTVGLFYIDSANFTPFNVSGGSALGAVGGGMAIALFSYLGVEAAAVAAAKDGLFPKRFKALNRHGVPAFGIVVSTLLASLAIIVNYLGSSGVTVFTTLVLMTGITAAVPYLFSALAQMKWRLLDRRELETPRFARDMVVAVLAAVFSVLFIWYSRDTGRGFLVYWAPFLLTLVAFAAGIPVYRAQRRGMKPAGGAPLHRPGRRQRRERAVVALGGNAHPGGDGGGGAGAPTR
jgi:amino acid transporter